MATKRINVSHSTMLATIMLFTVLTLPSVAGQSKCTDIQLSNCLVEVSWFWSKIYDQTATIIANMDALCLDSYRAIACMNRMKSDCSPVDVHILNGIESVMLFICKNEKIYQSHMVCVSMPQIESEIKGCLHTTEDYRNNSDKTCQFSHEDLTCIKTHVTKACNEEAGWLMYWYEYLILSGLHYEANCAEPALPAVSNIDFHPNELHHFDYSIDCYRIITHLCFQHVMDFYLMIENTNLTQMTESSLRDQCRLSENATKCASVELKAFKKQCLPGHYLILSSVVDETNYLCSDGFNSYISHQKCLIGEQLRTVTSECRQSSSTSVISSENDELCPIYENEQECVRNSTSSICGTEAGDFQYRRIRKRDQSTLIYHGCEKGGPTTKDDSKDDKISVKAAIGITVLVVFLMFVVFAVILVMVLKKHNIISFESIRSRLRGIKAEHSGAQRFHNEPTVEQSVPYESQYNGNSTYDQQPSPIQPSEPSTVTPTSVSLTVPDTNDTPMDFTLQDTANNSSC